MQHREGRLLQSMAQSHFCLRWLSRLCLFTAEGHDIYKDLRGPDGMLCCGGHECSAITNVKVLPDRSGYYLPDSDETIAAEDAQLSPDNRFHRCIYATVMRWDEQERHYVPQSGYSRTRCFFAPQALL